MSGSDGHLARASKWCYTGVWSFVTRWLKVPEEPPTLGAAADQGTRSFRPSAGFLRYLKFEFWVLLFIIDAVLTAAWIVLLVQLPWVGVLITPLALAVIILPDLVAYVAIHLRYDTTWYVLSDGAMRIRRGVWILHETTITYDNIQNVLVRQGPLQRFFGIADVVVETAGGGSTAADGSKQNGHQGLLEGLDNADELRNLIVAAWRSSGGAGLGDEPDEASPRGAGPWPPSHVAVLRDIRDAVHALLN